MKLGIIYDADKKMFKYTLERLREVCQEKGITLLEEPVRVHSESIIACYCTLCGGSMERSFRLIAANGALCRPCGYAQRRSRTEATNLRKYGAKNPMQNKDVRARAEATNLDRYGVRHPAQNPDIQQKMQETNLEKYGVRNAAQDHDIREKMRTTNMERYGVENPMQSEQIRESAQRTNLER